MYQWILCLNFSSTALVVYIPPRGSVSVSHWPQMNCDQLQIVTMINFQLQLKFCRNLLEESEDNILGLALPNQRRLVLGDTFRQKKSKHYNTVLLPSGWFNTNLTPRGIIHMNKSTSYQIQHLPSKRCTITGQISPEKYIKNKHREVNLIPINCPLYWIGWDWRG